MLSTLIKCGCQYRSVAKLNYDYTEKIIESWFKYIPYIKPYYAVKSFPNKQFLTFLSNYGNNIGFDCDSKYEIEMVKDISNQSDIIFANPTKSTEDILFAKNNNVNIYVIDSLEELLKINSINKYAQYIIRVRSEEAYSVMKFNRKFGAWRPEVLHLFSFKTPIL